MVAYIREIDILFRKIFAILPQVDPANVSFVNLYLCDVWGRVHELTAAFQTRSVSCVSKDDTACLT
jgi:hypothetical protein